VQRKLNESNYMVRKGAKGKCIVVHVDRTRKLPILQEVEGSVESSDSHTHTRENNEPTIPPCKRRRTQPATDMSSIHPVETAKRGDRADEISLVDKATDSNSEPIFLFFPMYCEYDFIININILTQLLKACQTALTLRKRGNKRTKVRAMRGV